MMLGWQEIVVAAIVLGCIILIGRKFFLFLRKIAKKDNPCDSCVSGCELKRQLDEKRKGCGVSMTRPTKKCCG